MSGEMVEAKLDPESLRKIIAMAKEAPLVVKKQVYERIREAAAPAADAAKESILSAPVTGGRTWRPMRAFSKGGKIIRSTAVAAAVEKSRLRSTGLRAGIAAGVSVGLGSGAMTMGVRITSSNRGLRADQSRMNRTYNTTVFRHPVFGVGSVTQAGKEWFYQPIEKKRPEITGAVQKAMDEAAERLAGL